MNNKFYSLLSDTTVKYMFKNDITKNWFLNLIKDLTKYDLSNLNLSDIELNSGNNLKNFRTDLRLTNNNSFTVIIEFNSNDKYVESISFKNRLYSYREESNNFDNGEKYHKKTTVLINFNNYYSSFDKDIKISNFLFTDRYNINNTINDIEIIEIFLPIYKDEWYNLNKEEIPNFYHKIAMLCAKSEKELKNLAITDEDKVLLNKWEELIMNNEFINAYDTELHNKKLQNSIKDEFYEQGLEQGLEQGIKKTAKNMLENNMEISLISKITNLTVEEINKLKEE